MIRGSAAVCKGGVSVQEVTEDKVTGDSGVNHGISVASSIVDGKQ